MSVSTRTLWSGLTVVLVCLIPAQAILAQSVSWETPELLYRTSGWIFDVLFLSGPEGDLHLLWSEGESKELELDAAAAIWYMTQYGGQWTEPVDVAVAESGAITRIRGAVDAAGYIHIVYQSRFDGIGGMLLYSNSPTAKASTAQAWQPPQPISPGPQLGGQIDIDPLGHLHVVYIAESLLAFHVTSADQGVSWQRSDLIPLQMSPNVTPYSPVMATDSAGVIHVLLNTASLPDGYPPLGAVYTSSSTDGKIWSLPHSLVPADHLAVSMLLQQQDEIHVLYLGRSGVPGRYHRLSRDGGKTWLAPSQITAFGDGLSGGDLELDSNRHIHAVFGVGEQIIAHSEWSGTKWGKWEQLNIGIDGAQEMMSIEICYGNRAYVIWEKDHTSIWYVEGWIDAPTMLAEGPTGSLPEATTLTEATISPQSQDVPPSLSPSIYNPSMDHLRAEPDVDDSWRAIVTSSVLAGLLSTFTILCRILRRKR